MRVKFDSEKQVLEQVKGYIITLLNNGVVLDNETPLEDIGLDSFKMINLIVRFEGDFSIEFYDEDLKDDNFRTVNTIVDLLCNKYKLLKEPFL